MAKYLTDRQDRKLGEIIRKVDSMNPRADPQLAGAFLNTGTDFGVICVPVSQISAASRSGGAFTPGSGDVYIYKYDPVNNEIIPFLDADNQLIQKPVLNLTERTFQPGSASSSSTAIGILGGGTLGTLGGSALTTVINIDSETDVLFAKMDRTGRLVLDDTAGAGGQADFKFGQTTTTIPPLSGSSTPGSGNVRLWGFTNGNVAELIPAQNVTAYGLYGFTIPAFEFVYLHRDEPTGRWFARPMEKITLSGFNPVVDGSEFLYPFDVFEISGDRDESTAVGDIIDCKITLEMDGPKLKINATGGLFTIFDEVVPAGEQIVNLADCVKFECCIDESKTDFCEFQVVGGPVVRLIIGKTADVTAQSGSANFFVEETLHFTGTGGITTSVAKSVNTTTVTIDGGGGAGGDNILVNSVHKTDGNFHDTTPAAPAGGVNVKWQSNTDNPDKISAHLAANDVSNTLLRDSAGFSVIGKFDTGTGDPADIAAGTDSVLGRDGSGNLAFATMKTGQCGDNQITFAKQADLSAASLLVGRGSAAGGGDPQEITLGSNLSMAGTVLNATAGGGAVWTLRDDTGPTDVTIDSGETLQFTSVVDKTLTSTFAQWNAAEAAIDQMEHRFGRVLIGQDGDLDSQNIYPTDTIRIRGEADVATAVGSFIQTEITKVGDITIWTIETIGDMFAIQADTGTVNVAAGETITFSDSIDKVGLPLTFLEIRGTGNNVEWVFGQVFAVEDGDGDSQTIFPVEDLRIRGDRDVSAVLGNFIETEVSKIGTRVFLDVNAVGNMFQIDPDTGSQVVAVGEVINWVSSIDETMTTKFSELRASGSNMIHAFGKLVTVAGDSGSANLFPLERIHVQTINPSGKATVAKVGDDADITIDLASSSLPIGAVVQSVRASVGSGGKQYINRNGSADTDWALMDGTSNSGPGSGIDMRNYFSRGLSGSTPSNSAFGRTGSATTDDDEVTVAVGDHLDHFHRVDADACDDDSGAAFFKFTVNNKLTSGVRDGAGNPDVLDHDVDITNGQGLNDTRIEMLPAHKKLNYFERVA